MRGILLLVSFVAVVAFGDVPAPGALPPRVVVEPSTVRLMHPATVAVSGLRGEYVQARLAGGTYPDGTLLRWRSLRLVDGVWRADLPMPALLGVYPVVLRRGPGSPAITTSSFLRVFAPGTSARPTFGDPAAVVRWWVGAVRHGTVVAVKRWPRPGFDRRDLRLHRLYVVAYSPPGRPGVQDRLGAFVTAFRNGYGARWQLLEATAEP